MKLNCPECSKEMHFISPMHIKMHGMSVEEFKNKYPLQQLKTEELKKHQSSKLSGKNHFNYGKHLNELTRSKISDTLTINRHKCKLCNSFININKEICDRCFNKNFEFKDSDEFVYCRICGLQSKNLTIHITKFHNISINEYRKRFVGASLLSKNNKTKICSKHFLHMSLQHKSKITEKSLITKNIKKDLESKFSINDYSKFLNKKIPEGIEDSDDEIFCRICYKKTKFISPAHLWKHKLTNFMYKQLFPDAPIVSKNTAKFIGEKSFLTKIKNGNMVIGKSYGNGGFRQDLNHYVRSNAEANFARILNFHNIKYQYEPTVFNLKESKFSIFTPDFLLDDNFYIWEKNTFIEIKGYEDSDTQLKHNDFMKQYPHIKMFVLKTDSIEWKQLKHENSYKINWE